MKYIKKFDRHADYEAYINGGGAVLPNVSYCVDRNEVHFNKYTPQPETRIVATFNVTDTNNPTDIVGYTSRYGYYLNSFDEIEIDGVVQSEVIGNYQFRATGEHIVKYTLVDPTEVGDYAFINCTALTSVTIPNSVTSLNGSVFSRCSSLSSVTIGNGVTTMGSSVFDRCTSLTSIIIPDSVTTIDANLFYGCSSLSSVTIGNGVTTISINAFSNCTSLTNITIPDSVTTISQNVFYDCTSLESITCLSETPPTIEQGTFNRSNDCLIYVPSESVDVYKSAAYWSDYASRIQAIQTT